MTSEDSGTHVLPLDAADRYLERVSALLGAAHLNSYFCSAERILRNLSALHSRTHGGLYTQLAVEPVTGLPAVSEWTRVHTDAALAAEAGPAPAIRDQRTEYLAKLTTLLPQPIEALEVQLRHVDHHHQHQHGGILHVRVIVDTVELTGLIVRFTVEMAETAQSVESQQLLIRNGSELYVSPDLRNRLSMLATASAESAFMELSAQPGVMVQRVAKATVGPFCLAELPATLPFGPLLTDPRGAFASFAFDVAALDIVRDGNNDPLPHRLMEGMAPDVVAENERARLRLGYHVYRDRKFVTDSTTLPAIEELCRSAGTRNIVYLAAIDQGLPEVVLSHGLQLRNFGAGAIA
jgi:hypothetical protein